MKFYWLYGVAGLVGAFLAWQVQGFRIDRFKTEFTEYKNQVIQQANEARQASLKQKEYWLKEKEDAEQKAAAREIKLRNDLAAAQSASRGLRDDLATLRTRLSESSLETCRTYVATLSHTLGECSERYSELAGTTDQCVSDVQTLMDSWPTERSTKKGE